jgi:hypothetical protein
MTKILQNSDLIKNCSNHYDFKPENQWVEQKLKEKLESSQWHLL